MDILEFASKREHEISRSYHQLAAKAPHQGIRNVLEMLASEEDNHVRIIEQMKQRTSPDRRETTVLEDGQVLLKKIQASQKKIKVEADELALYQEARDLEHEKEQYYRQKTAQAENPEQQTIFEALAREEHSHYVLMDNLCDLLARSGTYLEDAEFSHIDNYVDDDF